MRVPLGLEPAPNRFLQGINTQYDSHLPVSVSFHHASVKRGWTIGSKRWKKAWKRCMSEEYDRKIGSRASSLATWQELCAKVGIEEVFPSITKCRKALQKVHVNLVDLLDCWQTDEIPKCFPSRRALSAYTEETDRFFGRDIAKQDKVLKVLLRQLL